MKSNTADIVPYERRLKLIMVVKQWFKEALRRIGYDLSRVQPSEKGLNSFPDFSPWQKKIIVRTQPFTMTSVERLAALTDAVRYVCQHRIPGDLVECGVWRGGSMMAAALTLMAEGETNRHLYLYDTFAGMSSPSESDKSFDGRTAQAQLDSEPVNTGIWCHASIEEVKENLFSTGYPNENLHFVQGKVEETIPGALPSSIALLRLDTDWYESTKHELTYLFPILVPRGILILDDYGHWQGARKAVDEYLSQEEIVMFLQRIDYTGRIAVKV